MSASDEAKEKCKDSKSFLALNDAGESDEAGEVVTNKTVNDAVWWYHECQGTDEHYVRVAGNMKPDHHFNMWGAYLVKEKDTYKVTYNRDNATKFPITKFPIKGLTLRQVHYVDANNIRR